MIKPFFTLNGKIVHTYRYSFEIKQPYFPMIGYDHPNSIKVNFSNEIFKFDITKMITENSNTIICSKNIFINNPGVKKYINKD